jgi:large subunit ribosomal protein L35
MPKLKTHKGVKKRVKVTGGGRVRRHKAGARHLLAGKSSKRKRALRRPVTKSDAMSKRFLRLLGEG